MIVVALADYRRSPERLPAITGKQGEQAL